MVVEINIEDINEELISNNLYTEGIPDPDLMIRTSGEIRLSNFLPWQLVYSEFYFTDKLWPDFTNEDLDEAIEEFERDGMKTISLEEWREHIRRDYNIVL